jgi:hypothetical protein
MFQEVGHKRGIARALECLALSAAAHSNAGQSLRLAGAAAALRQRLGAPLTPTEQPRLEKALECARRTLGNAASLTAWMEGWAMPIEQAVREALDGGRGTRSSDSKLCLTQFAVLGSIRCRTAEMRFAGKPPRRACSRTVSSSGAKYTQ